MRIALAATEAIPFSKTGGLADVVGTLFKEYCAMEHDATLFVPLHRKTAEEFGAAIRYSGMEIDIPLASSVRKCRVYTSAPNVYFIGSEDYFLRDGLYGTASGDYPDNDQRFVFFSRSVLEICRRLDTPIDIMHCHDWHTGLIPLYMKTLYSQAPGLKKTLSVFTIHNLGYQGIFPPQTLDTTGLGMSVFNPECMEFYGNVNFLKAGIVAADIITTVSKTYAEEILTPEFGFGLDGVLRKRASSLLGVLNGIDTDEWNPSADKLAPCRYGVTDLSGKRSCRKHLLDRTSLRKNPSGPLMCFVGRLSSQKGVDLLAEAVPALVDHGANIVVIGNGDEKYKALLRAVSERFSDSFHLHPGFDEPFAHMAYAGSDFFLMPSRYEPCGLGQMIAMRYGTVPVAHGTGGLLDTIEDGKTGFFFKEFSLPAFMGAAKRAFKAFSDKRCLGKMIKNSMARDFSFRKTAEAYIAIYQNALQ